MLRRLLRRGSINYFLLFFGIIFGGGILLHVFNFYFTLRDGETENQNLDFRLTNLREHLSQLQELDKEKSKTFLQLQYRLQHYLSFRFTSPTPLPKSSDHLNRSIIDRFAGFDSRINRTSIIIDSPPISWPMSTNSTSSGNFDINQTISELYRQNLISNSTPIDLSVPGIFDYLPYLLSENPFGALTPSLRISKDRRDIQLSIGIPTTKRPNASYLINTLRSLIDNLHRSEKSEVLIVIFIGDINGVSEYVLEQVTSIYNEFPEWISHGLLEILVPSKFYYPNFDRIEPTFNDSPERMRWRTKQNLDYAYLMMYCQRRSKYYLQLEDDVITKSNYYEKIRDFIDLQSSTNTSWYLLEFSSLGFIGKLFRQQDLPTMIEFLFMFYKEKPVDWLLDHLFYVRLCHPEKSNKECQTTKSKFRLRYKPSLFQHVGVHSSLKGKVQKLRERDFGKQDPAKLRPRKSHDDNPPANLSTSLKIYQKYTLDNAYKGETVFWGLLPQAGDWILFEFTPLILLDGITLHSGASDHPNDMFYNTSVEILFSNYQQQQLTNFDNTTYVKTDDNYLIVGWFNENGSVNLNFNSSTTSIIKSNLVKALRLVVHSESAHWIILNEIWIRTVSSN